MNRNRLQLCLLVLLALPTLVQAQFDYITNNGAITITGYDGTDSNVVIPDTTNGYPVTAIGEDAFAGDNILTIVIPNSVTNVGDGAFADCNGLTDATIPDSVTSIGNDAFVDCSGLTNVTIGNNVISIGDEAFSECSDWRV